MNKSDIKTIRKFREVLRRFEREIFVQNNESCCNGVTLSQCHTLLEINSKNKESVTELAKNLGLDKSTISRTIDGLVNKGLVNRFIPEENRRMTTVELTQEGEDICNSINCNNDKYIADTLSVLTEQEREDFISSFEKITKQMILLRPSCFLLNKELI